jgi:ketosteroid isomerase-like protein
VRAAWAAAWTAKNADAVTALYASDAMFFTTQRGSVSGRVALRKLFGQALAAAAPRIELHANMTEASGNLGFDSGTYRETLTAASGTFDVRGSYLMVLRRTGPGWSIVQHMWTEDLPKGK